MIMLEQNYRSNQTILRGNAVIERNPTANRSDCGRGCRR